MWPQQMLLVFLLFNIVLGQSSRVEYVNVGQEDLLVTLFSAEVFSFVLSSGETYATTEFDYYTTYFWAYETKCENQSCTYASTDTMVIIPPWSDNINDTVSRYAIFPSGYNRAITIESLDNPDCPIASCEIDLEQDCPKLLQVKDEDGIVVACNITDDETFRKYCPNSAQILPDGIFDFFACQKSREFRVSVK